MTHPDTQTAPRQTQTFVWLHKPFTQTDKTHVFIHVWLSGYEWAKRQPEPDKVYFEINTHPMAKKETTNQADQSAGAKHHD